MEKDLNVINLEYQEVNKTSIYYKCVSILLILIFAFNPLSELIDVFRQEFFALCCLLPCPSSFSSYFFI